MTTALKSELANMTRDELAIKCQSLQERIVKQGKTLPGQPQYFMTPDGYILWQERTVSLRIGGGLTNIPGVGTVIDALGWDRLNEVLRVHVYLNPNAQMIGSPARAVRVSGAAVGCVGGVPQVHTLSLTWAFYDMFLTELIQKVKRNRVCGAMGIKGERPKGFDGKPLNFFEIEGGAGVWVDVSHDDIITTLKTLQERRSKPDRAAYTFLRRNLIRSFSGGISQKVPGESADIPVRGWYYPISKDRLEKIAIAAMRGTQADKEVELKTCPDEKMADANEGAAIEAELVDESTGEPVERAGVAPMHTDHAPVAPVAAAPAQPAAQPTQDADDGQREMMIDTLAVMFRDLTRDEKVAMKQRFPKPASTMALDELKEVHRHMSETLSMRAQNAMFS